MAGTGPYGFGTVVDINTISKRLGRLKRFVQINDVTKYKALSTTILADVTALNTLIQASTSNADLSQNPTLPIRDSEYQTSDS